MSQERWAEVDRYIVEHLRVTDPVLDAVGEANAAAGLPSIDVSPPQGKYLHLLARMVRARRILEIGTLGGFSTIWLARAVSPDGLVVTLELDPHHAEVARRNFDLAEVADRIDLRVGPALDTLQRMLSAGTAPFDLVFIDADKQNNAGYLDWALQLSRPGTVIVCDNVVRGGKIVDAGNDHPDIAGTRRLFEALRAEKRLDATAIQTVGSKGWDGFVIGIVA